MAKFESVLDRVHSRELSQVEAAEILGMSERTFRRWRDRYDDEGLSGLFDRRLGKASVKRVPVDEIAWMVEQYGTVYSGWTVKHFHDHLRKHHRFRWSYTWTKTQLHAAGLARPAPRRGAHRRKRPRRPLIGMLLHQDGSTHEWLEGQGTLDLIVTLDDANSEIYSAFLVEEEGTMSSFAGLLQVVAVKGLACALYTDRASHYFHTPEAGAKVDRSKPTQLGRALAQLGIEHIAAYSPQARGRSERAFATLQDRLVKELKLAGITTLEAARGGAGRDGPPYHPESGKTLVFITNDFALPAATIDDARSAIFCPTRGPVHDSNWVILAPGIGLRSESVEDLLGMVHSRSQRPLRYRGRRDVSHQPLAFSKDVCLFILDDVGIVFSEPIQEIYELNTTATFIWCQLEEGLSEQELAEALAGTFGFRGADAERYVREALADWRSRGFLAGFSAESPSKSRISDYRPLVATHPMPGIDKARDVWRWRCYRIFDDIYRVSFGSSEIESWVHPVLAHLEIPDESAIGPATSYYVIQDREAWLVGQLEGRAYCCQGLNAIASLVKMVVFSDALAKMDESIAIHAAAVGQGRMALVLPGRAGSGKSTLTAALVHEGLEYLTDDLIMLNADLSMMRGVPFSLSVKETGTEVLSGRFPYLRDLPLNIRPDSKRIRYLSLGPAEDDRGAHRSFKVGWIVFPTYDPEGTDELLSIGAGAALVRLMESCTMMRFVSTQSVGRLVALLGRVPCFEIRVSSLDRATNELFALCQDTPRKQS